MIELLIHSNEVRAKEILNILQRSYKIEADLIGAKYFPPLLREASDILDASSSFFGFHERTDLAGVIEIEFENGQIEITGLTVDPLYFRKGIAGKLIEHVKCSFQYQHIIVETAVKNIPAISLYAKHGFIETSRWRTADGIEKLAMRQKKRYRI